MDLRREKTMPNDMTLGALRPARVPSRPSRSMTSNSVHNSKALGRIPLSPVEEKREFILCGDITGIFNVYTTPKHLVQV